MGTFDLATRADWWSAAFLRISVVLRFQRVPPRVRGKRGPLEPAIFSQAADGNGIKLSYAHTEPRNALPTCDYPDRRLRFLLLSRRWYQRIRLE
jgi:hypothetical protein